jgi:hypothetical protein
MSGRSVTGGTNRRLPARSGGSPRGYRLERQAAEHARLAGEEEAAAQELEARGERARQAATRHDERAAEAEDRLEQL